MKKIICLTFLFFTTISFSQSLTGEDELYDQYKKVDKELNSVYNILKKELNETDKKNLVDAQKAWIKFRDLNCKFKIDCLIQSTIERTKELKNLIGGL